MKFITALMALAAFIDISTAQQSATYTLSYSNEQSPTEILEFSYSKTVNGDSKTFNGNVKINSSYRDLTSLVGF